MPSKGTGHHKTKKHHQLNVQHYERIKGVIPLSLSSLKRVVAQVQPGGQLKMNSHSGL